MVTVGGRIFTYCQIFRIISEYLTYRLLMIWKSPEKMDDLMSGEPLNRIFIHTDAQDRRPYFVATPVMSFAGQGGYAFEHRAVEAGSLGEHAFDAHALMLPVGPDPVRYSSRLNGRLLTGWIEPNRFRFLAHGDALSTSWDAPLHGLFLTLPQALFAKLLGEGVEARPTALRHVRPRAGVGAETVRNR